jgi:predicted metalloprotease
MVMIVFGWGCKREAARETTSSNRLPSTSVPVTTEQSDHYRTLLRVAAGQPGDIEQFWRAEFSRLSSSQPYVGPTILGALTPSQATQCGPVVQNAMYCAPDQAIAWDDSWLRDVGGAFTRVTDMGPLTIIANEWGHHIQRLTQAPTFSIGAELQADCYAGLYINYASSRGRLLTLESGDVAEAARTFFLIGDQRFDESKWFQRGVHGPPAERSRAFRRGYLAGDPSECAAYQTYQFRPPVTAGPYMLNMRPGWQVISAAGADPIEMRGPGCTIQMRPLASLMAKPAADQFEAVKRAWFGNTVTEIGLALTHPLPSSIKVRLRDRSTSSSSSSPVPAASPSTACCSPCPAPGWRSDPGCLRRRPREIRGEG